MRIGINTLFLVPGDVGGTEVYLRENLKEMVPASPNDTFILFTALDNDQSLRRDLERFPNVEFVRLPFRAAIRPLRIIAEQTALPLQVSRQKPDVLWSPGYTAPLCCPCPQVVTIHDLQYKTYPEDLSFLERMTLDFLVKKACRKCHSILAVSEFSKREIIKYNFAEDEKIHVVYEGVDPAFAESTGIDVSNIIEVPPGIPYILCVAHTYPHKKVHVLIEAYAKLADDIPHHLVLVGQARRGEPEVQARLDSLSDKTKIHRIERAAYPELKTIFQAADLFVLPSEYEGFGLPILEALLAGVPTIATHKASLPEVGGDCVIYVEESNPHHLAEKIAELHSLSVEARVQLRNRGRTWGREFSWKKSADGTLRLLKQLAD